MTERAEWEIHILFLIWGAMLLWTIARPYRRAWVESLWTAAALFAAIPIVNALTVPRNMLTGIATGDWLFVAFDVAMLTLAFGFRSAARKAATVMPPRTLRRARQAQEAMATA